MKQFIQFKKQRELGEMISDVFAFLRNEYKPFFALILQITLPYLILFFVGLGFMLYSFGDLTSVLEGASTFDTEEMGFLTLGISILVLVIAGIMVYALAYSATLHYVKSYTENNGTINTSQVKTEVKNTFWSFIGLSILKGLALFVGFMLCFLPGVYLVVPMAVVFCIMIFENKSVMDAFSDSFKFVKDEWWMSFLTLFVVTLLIGVIGFVLNLPATIYTYIKMGIFSGEFNPEANPLAVYKDPIYIILNLVSYAFKFFLNFITIIVTIFIYYNINEKKNHTGTFEQIDSLGNTQQ
ncbi:hypothetical protein [Lacinutrix venerupis]|uniref:Glycerophosphoryl diester phosphodiesterase family protein n=1 Tax=Lacinutrix venerupis TaxID=1486034 RepID=A0AAC9LN74_9FLAO|nr:hypothetical protein [Lacinutrix venerupis]APX99761.1 hypothetical protein BWR22_05365 [Lacinutrix venerupis]